MIRHTTTDERYEIANALPTPLRVGLGAVGAFIALMSLHDIWRGLAPMSPVSLLLLLPGTGLVAGGFLVAAMIWGPDERWVVLPGRLIVVRTLRRFRSEMTHAASDISSISVDTVDWDSRPDTFKLRITLTTGRRLRSPDFATHGAAESARRMLLAARP